MFRLHIYIFLYINILFLKKKLIKTEKCFSLNDALLSLLMQSNLFQKIKFFQNFYGYIISTKIA